VSRTPSASAHEKVLKAALRLIGEHGIDGTSMDAIARLSGVSKATLYNHWKDKHALCLEVVSRLRTAPPEFRSGDPRRDLLSLLTYSAQASRPGRTLKILPRIIGYAATNPRFGREFRAITLGPTEAQLRRIVTEAISKGELVPETDPEVATSLLFGPIVHRKMMGGTVPPGLPEKVVDGFWRNWGATRSN